MPSVAEPGVTLAPPRYEFKPSPYSSHSLLLASLPTNGSARRVLDVGCAGGYLAEILANRGYQVTGLESPGRAGEYFPSSVRLVEVDLDGGLPPLPGGFDYIICADILEHLRDPLTTLQELRPLLAPGGRLVASLPNSGHAYFRWKVLMGRFPQHDKGLFDRTHLHFFPWRGWVDLFGAAGFRFEQVHCSSVPFGLAFPGWNGSLERALERIYSVAARTWKALFAYQFIVVARPEPSA